MWKYLKKYIGLALLAPLFMLGEAGMDLLQPRLMAAIVDDGVLGLNNGGVGDLSLVISLGLRMIGLIALGGVCGILSGVFANQAAQRFGNDVRKDTFQSIMRFSFSEIDRFTTGSLITRVTNDITQVQNMIQMAIRGYVRTIILLVGGMICMLQLHLSFGTVLLIAIPLIIVTLVFFLSKITPKFSILQERLDQVNNVMQENVTGNRVVKAYIQEEQETARFRKANSGLIDTQLSILFLMNYMSPIVNIILNVSVLAIIWVGRIQVEQGAVTPGNVMAAITYLSQILNALMRLGMMFQNISRGRASAKRITEVLNTKSSIVDGTCEGASEPPHSEHDTARREGKQENALRKSSSIEFVDVSFGYEGRENILEHISFRVEPGETVGIMGMTGSGKTSLISLIPRFYDVTAGKILIDGRDVKEYKLSTLRSMVAVALQRSELFHATISENITMGREFREDDFLLAVKVAQAKDFIEQKEHGYDEMVAQDGHSLSGGQKQRIAVARAILRDANVLIFDDATSALDLATEKSLYTDLDEYYPGRTKLIVAQRITSIQNADKIIVLEDGTISAMGTHKELLQASKVYREIYDSQMGGE